MHQHQSQRTRDERLLAGELFRHWPRLAHGPLVAHGHVDELAAVVLADAQQRLVDGEVLGAVAGVAALGRAVVNGDDLAVDVGRHHDLVRAHELVFVDLADDAAAREDLALAHARRRAVRKLARGAQRRHVHAQRHKRRLAGAVEDDLQRPLDAVENVLHDARAQLNRQRRQRALNGVARRQPRRVLVALDGRVVALQLDDLALRAARSEG